MPLSFAKRHLSRLMPQPAGETEFLPAALEIIETPASPTSRLIGGTIIGFFVVAILWASLGKIDIVATAQGKIMPSSRTKIIQAFETGVVRKINVHDGQSVKAGDVLLEIDTTISGAERDRIQQELLQAQLDAARYQAATKIKTDPAKSFIAPDGVSDEQIAMQQIVLQRQLEEIRAKLDGLDNQIARGAGNQAATAAAVERLKHALPLLQERSRIHQDLAAKGYGSKLTALSAQQEVTEQSHELIAQEAHLTEAAAMIASLRQERRQAEAEYLRENLNNMAIAQQKAASLQEQLLQATQRFSLQTLKAPVDGTVQQLAMHTEGGVVTPAQALMAIVPAGGNVEIEAMVSNRDIGFVYPDQDVAVKIDTFNFTKYGTLQGKVISISQDAITQQKPVSADQMSASAGGQGSEPAGQQLVYAARIALPQNQMNIDGKMVNLTPGMAVTAEIKTGSRRLMDYLLSPLARHQAEAFRER